MDALLRAVSWVVDSGLVDDPVFLSVFAILGYRRLFSDHGGSITLVSIFMTGLVSFALARAVKLSYSSYALHAFHSFDPITATPASSTPPNPSTPPHPPTPPNPSPPTPAPPGEQQVLSNLVSTYQREALEWLRTSAMAAAGAGAMR
jgi:hypothetical protein